MDNSLFLWPFSSSQTVNVYQAGSKIGTSADRGSLLDPLIPERGPSFYRWSTPGECSMPAANGQPRTANRSTTKKHPIIPSLHDVTKGRKSSVMVFFCCASCAYVHCLTTPTPKHHLTRTALRWPSGILWDPKRLADLLVAKLFCCKQPHLGRRMLLQPFNQWIQWAHLDFRKTIRKTPK